MSSSLAVREGIWDVSNMRFRRIMRFALDVAAELAENDAQRGWIGHVDNVLEAYGWAGDLDGDEFFRSRAGLEYRSTFLYQVRVRIYQRQIGNHKDQTWQTSTIGCVYELGKLQDEVRGWRTWAGYPGRDEVGEGKHDEIDDRRMLARVLVKQRRF